MFNPAKKYNLIAPLYDYSEKSMDKGIFAALRKKALHNVQDGILEVGIGTGKNLEYYDQYRHITGVDVSSHMLKYAEIKRRKLGMTHVKLEKMDVEQLDFPDGTFNTVVSTCVFCTVPHPLKGLKEVKRVLKTGGKAIFVEHMRSSHWYINVFLYLINIFSRLILGTSMIRKTEHNIRKAGLNITHREVFLGGVVRLIIAEKNMHKGDAA